MTGYVRALDSALVIFDVDGTLVRSFMREGGGGASREYDLVEPLPGRREVLRAVRSQGATVGLATNQAGVAFGYQTEEQVRAKLLAVKDALELPRETVAAVCFAHPDRPRSFPLYARGYEWDPAFRKPAGAMLQLLMSLYAIDSDHTVYVGDMLTDAQAAADADVDYVDAAAFFEGRP